jgi:hypothetical protein
MGCRAIRPFSVRLGVIGAVLVSSLHGKLEGKTLEVTWYDGSVQTVRDIRRDTGGLLRKGPAFIGIR